MVAVGVGPERGAGAGAAHAVGTGATGTATGAVATAAGSTVTGRVGAGEAPAVGSPAAPSVFAGVGVGRRATRVGRGPRLVLGAGRALRGVAFRNGGPGLVSVEDGRERCGGRLVECSGPAAA